MYNLTNTKIYTELNMSYHYSTVARKLKRCKTEYKSYTTEQDKRYEFLFEIRKLNQQIK